MKECKNLADSLNKNKDAIPRARRFRDNLTKIESILSTGVRIKYLVDHLNEYDFKITMKTFKEELHNARKQLKQQGDSTSKNSPKQTNESPKQNTELSSSDEIAKSYFKPKFFLTNKETK
jgi:hypothetical protein